MKQNQPTADGVWSHIRLADLSGKDACSVQDDASLVVREGVICWLGLSQDLPAEYAGLVRRDGGGALVTPGLIDCHTHLVYGGQRANEFAMRLAGASYEKVARAGGGIASSVQATRDASEDDLSESAALRLESLLAYGVCAIEIKSGYGLALEHERKQLRVARGAAARRLGDAYAVTVRTTFLGAHALPPEYAGRSGEYIDLVCNAMLPTLASEGLVDAVDVFCERIAFSLEETARVFDAAKALGLPVKLHAEQLSDMGGAALAARYGALSCDHIEHLSQAGIDAMRAAGTVAVLLPGAYYTLRDTQLPAIAALRAAGIPMAVSTDHNPGTSPALSLLLMMNMACTVFRLTVPEAIAGVTVHAAKALEIEATHGRIAADALLPTGWASNVLLRWDADGKFVSARPGSLIDATVPIAQGPVIPGMPNLHSHAFQRAFAGLTEYRTQADDSFWSWRTLMYRFAARLGPAQMEAIATWLYTEMLECGYTHVCEFQYLHHDTDGRPYADDAELSTALLRAAAATGIGFTLLPVLYQSSGFGGQPPNDGQRRFIRSTDNMLGLLARLAPLCMAQGATLGLAPHSLRAVAPDALAEAVAGLHAMSPSAPVHIHIAEQSREVDDCIAWSGQRPVAWLLDHAPVDARWCLVHATHMDAAECRRAAQSGAVAGLCPTTEANLGDGLFDFAGWSSHGGAWGVGSDSHASVNAAEELMLLEYGQRLALRRRNVAATAAHPHVATALTQAAASGGAQAAGRGLSGLAPGAIADFVVLDATHVALSGLPAADMLSSHVFASNRTSAIASVWAAGRERVVSGRHVLHRQAAAGFVAARSQLLQD